MGAPVVLRAEVTNPGLPDVENGWKTVGPESDLPGVAERLRREGWAVSGA